MSQCTTPDVISVESEEEKDPVNFDSNLDVALDKNMNTCKELAVHFRKGKEPKKASFRGLYEKYVTKTQLRTI